MAEDSYEILVVEPDKNHREEAKYALYRKKNNGADIDISTATNYWDARKKFEEGVDGIITSDFYNSGMNARKTFEAGKALKRFLKPQIEEITDRKEENPEDEFFNYSDFLGGERDDREVLPLAAEMYENFLAQWMGQLEEIDREEEYEPPKVNKPPMSILLTDYVRRNSGFDETPLVVCTNRYRRGAKSYPVIETLKDIMGPDFEIEAPYKKESSKGSPAVVSPLNVHPEEPEPVTDQKPFNEAYETLAKRSLNAYSPESDEELEEKFAIEGQ